MTIDEAYMVPGLQVVLPGSVSPNAPDDMFAAMEKNGQLINVVPGEKIVVIRMGDAPVLTLFRLHFRMIYGKS